MRSNFPIDNVVFLHDSARPYTSIRTRETITSFGWTTLPHHPYSPDLAPSDYHLFGPMKERQTVCKWQGSKNCRDEVVQRTVKRILRGRDTCSHSKVWDYYWEKQWLCCEVRMRATENQLHFCCMIHVPVSVIIPVLKKNALLFDSPSYRVTPQKTEPINFFITSTKIKQNNSNFVHSDFWTCWWILWSQFFMHRIYFIYWKKEKARIKFMNFSQKYMGCVFLGGGDHPVCKVGYCFRIHYYEETKIYIFPVIQITSLRNLSYFLTRFLSYYY